MRNSCITVFPNTSLVFRNQNKVDPSRAKKASSIQHCSRKCETHARVLSRTFAHGNSEIEIRLRNRGRRQSVNSKIKKYSGHEIYPKHLRMGTARMK